MDCDVIVIGAGPSGSAATYFLTSRGLSVICVERLGDPKFSRYHNMCGECISAKGLRIVGVRQDEVRNRIHSFRIDWPGGVRTEFKVDGYIISRVSVIRHLRTESESKGAVFVKGVVSSVQDDGTLCTVTLSDGRVLKSRFVVGADGAHSVTRRCVFGSEPHALVPVAISLSEQGAIDGTIAFKLKGRGEYYEWFFPSGTGSSTGAVNHHLSSEAQSTGARAIPVGWVDHIVKGNVVLVGDAAGLVNPMSFGGLRIAFDSALHAAEAVAASDLSVYEKWWKASPLSDRRFEKVAKELSTYDDSDYSEFAKHLGHGLYLSGFLSVVTHPTRTWIYIGCLMAVRNGW